MEQQTLPPDTVDSTATRNTAVRHVSRRIVSSTPGRLRIKDAGLRNAARLEQLTAALAEFDGMLEFERNPRIGSLTVHFDCKIVAIEKLESTVDLLVDRILRQPAQPGKSRRRQINRYAKIGMLGSLTASLALLAAGQKRGHAIAGALFVASLSVHLGLHRKHLLR